MLRSLYLQAKHSVIMQICVSQHSILSNSVDLSQKTVFTFRQKVLVEIVDNSCSERWYPMPWDSGYWKTGCSQPSQHTSL